MRSSSAGAFRASHRSRLARRSRAGARGFTLIETAISMGILGISMAVFMDGTLLSTSVKSDVRQVTRATLVARAVMSEVEQKLIRDGFGAFEQTSGCDFRIDALKEFHCDYQVRKVELPIGDMIQKLMTVGGGGLANAVGGLAGGGAGSSSSTSAGTTTPPISAGAMGGLSGLAGMAGGGGLGSLMGGAGGGGMATNALQLYASQMEAMLEEALREVRVTISWKVTRKKWDSLTVVTHFVEIGRAGVSAQDQLSGQMARQGGLNSPTPGQMGQPGQPGSLMGMPGMPQGGTGTMTPFQPNVSFGK